jgi:hypothetical protein
MRWPLVERRRRARGRRHGRSAGTGCQGASDASFVSWSLRRTHGFALPSNREDASLPRLQPASQPAKGLLVRIRRVVSRVGTVRPR